MALKRWNGTGYEDVSLARYRAAEGGPDVEPQHAYVWDGTQFVEVWSASIYPASG